MKKYLVELPISGYIVFEVEAENEKGAIEKAMEIEWTFEDVQELETYEKLIEGNVCYAWHNTAEATEINDEDS